MGWIGFCIEVRAITKQSKIHPNTTKHTKTWVSGATGWIGSLRCKKIWCNFVAQTFALIAPVQPVLQLASCSNETIQNAPKHYETHQNMSLGSNRVDRVDSLQKKLGCEFVARTFALIALVQPVLHRVSCSKKTIQNAPKYYKTHQYMS